MNDHSTPKGRKSDAEWRETLTPEQYAVAREKGTERPFTGQYYDCKDPGTYHCICCGAELFTSDDKYDSGCGWPSFTQPANGVAIEYTPDRSHGMIRTEVTCRECGAHLGHVFEDGPKPTGQRYCMNGTALKFDPGKGDKSD